MNQQENNCNIDHHSTSSRLQYINVETKTEIKKVHIVWHIDRQNVDVALSSSQNNKREVLDTVVEYDGYKLRFELCVGWRRSLQGFSAFFLTVPQSRVRKSQSLSAANFEQGANTIHVRDNHDASIEMSEHHDVINANFMAKYTVSFGNREERITRTSSIRSDFDLGVGFPNFCELTKLTDLMTNNMLELHIDVEIYERSSTLFEPPSAIIKGISPSVSPSSNHPFMSKLYHEKLYCDSKIVGHYFDELLIKKHKAIKLHKCILVTASPVFADMLQLRGTSCIDMPEWHINTVLSMVKFLYLGCVELYHAEMRTNDELSLSMQNGKEENSAADLDAESDEVKQEEKACVETMDEDVKCCEDESCAADHHDHTDDMCENKTHQRQVQLSDVYQECAESAQRLLALFELAELYELADLIEACCDHMLACITPSTCCVFLCYLDKYSQHNGHMTSIKQYLLHYIVSHIGAIKRSKGYLYILQSRHHLLSELIAKINLNAIQ